MSGDTIVDPAFRDQDVCSFLTLLNFPLDPRIGNEPENRD
jgi:hypothetical protein